MRSSTLRPPVAKGSLWSTSAARIRLRMTQNTQMIHCNRAFRCRQGMTISTSFKSPHLSSALALIDPKYASDEDPGRTANRVSAFRLLRQSWIVEWLAASNVAA